MPYITHARRMDVRDYGAQTAGELNYAITSLLLDYIENAQPTVSYDAINTAIGVLECAKLELYRRIAAPYEDEKKEANGDVYY